MYCRFDSKIALFALALLVGMIVYRSENLLWLTEHVVSDWLGINPENSFCNVKKKKMLNGQANFEDSLVQKNGETSEELLGWFCGFIFIVKLTKVLAMLTQELKETPSLDL